MPPGTPCRNCGPPPPLCPGPLVVLLLFGDRRGTVTGLDTIDVLPGILEGFRGSSSSLRPLRSCSGMRSILDNNSVRMTASI